VLLAAFVAPAAAATPSPPARMFTVPSVRTAFQAQTGLPLVVFAAASTPEVTSLRSRPHLTERFGEFQIFVLKPSRVARMRRVFTNGRSSNRRGIYWVPDQAGGWIAVTLYDRNLVVAWFSPSGSRRTDARWGRLQHAVDGFAPRTKPRLPA
jgi:hypothetical protein